MEKSKLNVRTKDELVKRLRVVIEHLSDFIDMSEKLIASSEETIDKAEFSLMLENIKGIPEELKFSPLLLEETIDFVEGIIGEVHDIRMQIESSFSRNDGMLKNAVEVLDKIPDSTFKATDQILNTVDCIMAREGEMEEIFNRILEKKEVFTDEEKTGLDRFMEIFGENQNDHFGIMDALQFQDITTQQIQHVNDLLEKTEVKLSELAMKLRGLDEADIKKILEESARKKARIYDNKAEFTDRTEEQKVADEVYEKKEELNQDDIEDLLAQFGN